MFNSERKITTCSAHTIRTSPLSRRRGQRLPARHPSSTSPPRPPQVAHSDSSRRRRLALAAVAVLTIAGGTVGGALAGRQSEPSAAQQTTTGQLRHGIGRYVHQDRRSSTPSRMSRPSSARRCPGVVSINVVLNSGQAAGTGFVISSDGQIATNAHVVADATVDRGRVLRRFDSAGQGARCRSHRRPRGDQGRQDRASPHCRWASRPT